jgi:hypothetical protein
MPRLVKRVIEWVGGLALRLLLLPCVLAWLCLVPDSATRRLGEEENQWDD